MDKIEKALQKLTQKERGRVKDILKRLFSGNVRGLDIKKLKAREDIFRVRKSDIRIIYQVTLDKKIVILTIERRHEDTYRF